MTERITTGQHWASKLATLFASWWFLLITIAFLNIWAALNSFHVIEYDTDWGKADFGLSQLTYLVDIIIIMSQKRQSIRDRLLLNRLIAMETDHGKKLDALHGRLDQQVSYLISLNDKVDTIGQRKKDINGRYTKI